MKQLKQILCLMLALCICVGLFAGCGRKKDDGRLTIVVTVFPVYDWVRNLLGDRAGEVELVLLEDSGADMHNFQPTIEDIYKISTCDLFVYIGGESDKWVADTLRAAENKNMVAVGLLAELGTAAREEEEPDGPGSEHDHEHEEVTEYDEHVWLSVKNAKLLCPVLAEKLAQVDAEHAETYRANCAAYAKQLDELDAAFEQAVSEAPGRTVLFADRYPFLYLIKDYGLTAYAAFSGCSAETEASFDMISFLVGKLDGLGLKHILVLEGSTCRIANTIISESAAKDAEILEMDSMQSVTPEQISAGTNYLAIMQKNLEVLKQALS
ncbi:MAG: zinc ABC transporter substrate-binding protein [Oscillospiraceae bacterium]|nr:zinc ABC transporter substrate-binding protein [Oscillospiraceae bacterium]